MPEEGFLLTVFVVEDFAPFRQLLCRILRTMPEIGSITEIDNGLDAVEKARELEPDLILLDIGLPGLHGIEVARRIKVFSPRCKLLFVSQESEVDIMRAALGAGGSGYLVKADAAGELIAAFDAILAGKQYVSSRFTGHNIIGTTSENLTDSKSLAAPPRLHRRCLHEVIFYSDRSHFLGTFADFLTSSLKAGDAAVVMLTKSKREVLVQRLQIMGLDIAALTEEGRYISLDTAEVLETFMVKGLPDRTQFLKIVTGIAQRATRRLKQEHNCVVFCGECAPRLWSEGNAEGALKLEQLWNEFGQSSTIQILCAYPLVSFDDEVGRYVQEQLCHEHTAVYLR